MPVATSASYFGSSEQLCSKHLVVNGSSDASGAAEAISRVFGSFLSKTQVCPKLCSRELQHAAFPLFVRDGTGTAVECTKQRVECAFVLFLCQNPTVPTCASPSADESVSLFSTARLRRLVVEEYLLQDGCKKMVCFR